MSAEKRPVGRPGQRGASAWPQVAFRLSPEQREALARLAESAGVSITAYVAELVGRHVRTQTGPNVARRQRREARQAAFAAGVAADRERAELRDEQ